MFGVFALFDFVAENIFQYLEIFKYVGAYAPLTIWAGTEHQYPIYNSFIMASFFMGMTCMRYFKDDRGNSLCERGIEQIRASAASKTVLRQFALMGFLSLNIFVLYYTPYLLFSMKADSFPEISVLPDGRDLRSWHRLRLPEQGSTDSEARIAGDRAG